MYPLISIIVPVYNVEPYLSRCIDSLLAQSYPHTEILLVDDGSTDRSGAICDAYAAQHDHVTVRHTANGGPGAARNNGLEIARGAYVTFVDADDHLPPDALQWLYDRMQTDDSDLVIGNFIRTYADNTQSAPCCTFADGVYTLDAFLEHTVDFCAVPASACGRLYRRAVLDGVQFPSVSYGEDTVTFPRVLERCTRISLDSRPVYYYFIRRDSLMRETDDNAMLGHLHASLTFARFLWDHHRVQGTANWFAAAIRNAVTIRRRGVCLRTVYGYFDRAACRTIYRHMGMKGKIAWLCLHIPLTNRLLRRRAAHRG